MRDAELTAYFDESVSSGDEVMAVGGFISTEKKWRRFDREWRAELAYEHLPYFHATELESQLGVFRGWPKERKIQYQQRIIPIMRQHGSFAVGCALILPKYNEVVGAEQDPEMRKKVGSPYALLVASAIRLAVKWARSHYPGDSVAVVCEDGAPQKAEVSQWFERMKLKEPILHSLAVAGKESLRLQASDFFAYEHMKHVQNWWVDGMRRPVRRTLDSIIEMPCDGKLWDEAKLRTYVEDVRHSIVY